MIKNPTIYLDPISYLSNGILDAERKNIYYKRLKTDGTINDNYMSDSGHYYDPPLYVKKETENGGYYPFYEQSRGLSSVNTSWTPATDGKLTFKWGLSIHTPIITAREEDLFQENEGSNINIKIDGVIINNIQQEKLQDLGFGIFQMDVTHKVYFKSYKSDFDTLQGVVTNENQMFEAVDESISVNAEKQNGYIAVRNGFSKIAFSNPITWSGRGGNYLEIIIESESYSAFGDLLTSNVSGVFPYREYQLAQPNTNSTFISSTDYESLSSRNGTSQSFMTKGRNQNRILVQGQTYGYDDNFSTIKKRTPVHFGKKNWALTYNQTRNKSQKSTTSGGWDTTYEVGRHDSKSLFPWSLNNRWQGNLNDEVDTAEDILSNVFGATMGGKGLFVFQPHEDKDDFYVSRLNSTSFDAVKINDDISTYTFACEEVFL